MTPERGRALQNLAIRRRRPPREMTRDAVERALTEQVRPAAAGPAVPGFDESDSSVSTLCANHAASLCSRWRGA